MLARHPQSLIRNHSFATTFPRRYCPINRKIGFSNAEALLACGPARTSVTTVSGGKLVPELFVLLSVVFTTAIAPASHMLTYTRLLSAAAAVNTRNRVVVGEYRTGYKGVVAQEGPGPIAY